MRARELAVAFLVFWIAIQAGPAEEPLTPESRFVPGATASHLLTYANPSAQNVLVAGSWDAWKTRSPMTREGALWVFDVRPLQMPYGRHEFKFIVNDEWEPGENRVLHVNEEHLLERPPDVIVSAVLEAPDEIVVFFKRGVKDEHAIRVWLEPDVALEGWKLIPDEALGFPRGYRTEGGAITFALAERTYRIELLRDTVVSVAGNFNGWDGSGKNPRWRLSDPDDDGIWHLSLPLPALQPPPGETELQFKFVVNGNRWLSPPAQAANAVDDGKGNRNLRVEPGDSGSVALRVKTREPLDLSRNYLVAVEGIHEKVVRRMASPEGVLNALVSTKELGAQWDRVQEATTYRLFAPRAGSVHLCLFEGPHHAVHEPEFKWLEPHERYPMWRDPADGVWEISLSGLDLGSYYAFNVAGPAGDGEAFNPDAAIGDPYAVAVANAENNPLVIDREATNQWFGGWTDDDWVAPSLQDAVIYETHVRDLTMHPSSGVPAQERGKYRGILASEGTGTGLDHLRALGVNYIELLPVGEFNNGAGEYNWGYATTYFFAPEASYSHDPARGSAYYEFKHLVNELHRKGFGVILDVVYNHVGSPNLFSMIDKKYYFRLTPDYAFLNFSGVGNDFRTEAPMARRLIVDNVLYWMKDHHVDGFRFDLAELIDMETMLAIRDAARAVNPNVILISEPWSFRGENKAQLRGTEWSAWNNDFRYAAKDFVAGRGERDWLRKSIFGSVETWAADPRQPVNYVESHDDMTLADELSTAPNHDGRNLIESDVRQNRLAATILFTSLGIPMLGEGQEFLRSKQGIHNSYNKGDAINALNWEDRARPLARETLEYYRGLVQLRQSPPGAAFRVSERPPPGYYRWIMPGEQLALGYVVNAPRIHKGSGFIVLLNASARPVPFEVPVPQGTWRMIGDGTRILPEGFPDKPVIQGPRRASITVPGISSVILRDGF